MFGITNLPGLGRDDPSRSSFGNAKPIISSSREKARYTILADAELSPVPAPELVAARQAECDRATAIDRRHGT